MAELIEMPFEMLSRVIPGNRILDESADVLAERGTFRGVSGLLQSIGFWEFGERVS